MNAYQLTVLIKADYSDEEKDKFSQKLEKLFKTFGGVVGKVTQMGKKQLAYKINNLTQADYINWELEMEPERVVELSRKLDNDKEVIRYLLIKRVISAKKLRVSKKKK